MPTSNNRCLDILLSSINLIIFTVKRYIVIVILIIILITNIEPLFN